MTEKGFDLGIVAINDLAQRVVDDGDVRALKSLTAIAEGGHPYAREVLGELGSLSEESPTEEP